MIQLLLHFLFRSKEKLQLFDELFERDNDRAVKRFANVFRIFHHLLKEEKSTARHTVEIIINHEIQRRVKRGDHLAKHNLPFSSYTEQ